jgi:hypothetical protein
MRVSEEGGRESMCVRENERKRGGCMQIMNRLWRREG